METWYQKVKADLTLLPDFIIHYTAEYEEAKLEVKLMGSGNLERSSAGLPHILEHRFSQLQDIEAILRHLNIQYEKLKSDVFRKWFENQKAARVLTARECERFAEADDDVITMAELVNDVALIRNLYLSILKGLDAKSWQIQNVIKLRVAGLDDARI